MDYCKGCPARNTCQSICPELELHLKEIEVPQRKKTIGLVRYGRVEWGSSVHLTKTEREIATLLAKGMSRADVCELLNIKRKSLRDHLNRMKKKHLK